MEKSTKISTVPNYQNKGSQFVCLSVVLIDSVFRAGKNCYLQVFLEEFKYVAKEKKMAGYITDNKETSSEFDREDSDEENYNEENSDEKNLLKKIVFIFIFEAFQAISSYLKNTHVTYIIFKSYKTFFIYIFFFDKSD